MRSARERAGRAARAALGRPVEGALVWHAVPSVLSRSSARIGHLVAAWQEHVCAGRRPPVLRTSDPDGQGVLAVVSGADPYGLTAQMPHRLELTERRCPVAGRAARLSP